VWSVAVIATLTCLVVFKKSFWFLRFYPVLVSAGFLVVFGGSFLCPPVMVYRFATAWDKSIKGTAKAPYVEAYCRIVNGVWCGFFVMNGGLALGLALWGSDAAWALHPGGVSDELRGLLFGVEWVMRRRVARRIAERVRREADDIHRIKP
jgi:uncharacterized membrane protein